jgi:hypothetical protein
MKVGTADASLRRGMKTRDRNATTGDFLSRTISKMA